MTNQEYISLIVDKFYDQAKTDVLIGYHFLRIHDFDSHLPRIKAFWELQFLGKTEINYGEKFNVIKKHLPLGIKTGEVNRWIKLFKDTLKEHDHDLQKPWLAKIDHFQTFFLRNPLLFPD